MSNKRSPNNDPGQLMVYQVKLRGHLDQQWADWFGKATITLQDNGNTLLCSPAIDQAALYGLLKKVRDLGMPLLSVIGVEPDETDTLSNKTCRHRQ